MKMAGWDGDPMPHREALGQPLPQGGGGLLVDDEAQVVSRLAGQLSGRASGRTVGGDLLFDRFERHLAPGLAP
ncbi:MAG: hypothetical protein BMS9Abin29_2623 [Gemmatimonadota bacterium]|nr:MAG: hypothetical protein BMS9Abin29_2623 [Gemmatimonadota bacterium]